MARHITVQYLADCPHRRLMEQRLAEALALLGGPPPQITFQEIPDAATGERMTFRGSPSVLIDGVDPFADTHTPIGFACRIYQNADGMQPVPSVEDLCDALS